MSDLLVTIGADTSQYNSALQGMGSTATSASSAVVNAFSNQQKSIEQLTIKLASYQQVVYKATDPARIIEYNQKIDELNSEIGRMSNLGRQGFGSLSTGAMSASMKLAQMRSGMSAARDGVMAFTVGGQAGERMLMAMGHHITSLVNETGSLKGAFGALVSSLMGTGGVILAISLAAELWQKYEENQKKAAETQTAFQKANETSASSAGDELTKLTMLYDASQNLNLSHQQRLSAVRELQSLYPAYFGNLSQEAILAGQAKGAYDALTTSLFNKAAIEGASSNLKDLFSQLSKLKQFQQEVKTSTDEANAKGPFHVKNTYSDLLVDQSGGKNEFTSFSAETKKLMDQIKASRAAMQEMLQSTGVGSLISKDDINQIEQIRAEIKRMQLDILAHPENKDKDLLQIEQLKKQLAELNPTIQRTKDGLAALKAERDKLAATLQDGIISGKIKSTDFSNPILKQLEALDARILKVTADFNILMGLSPRPGRELLPTNTGLGSERGIGQGADNGGLLENSGVHSFGQNDLDTSNAGLGNTHDDVVASMKKGAEAFSTETYQIKEQQQAWKRYQDELKAVNNVVNVFGGGLTRAFESALSGTQSFVSAMGQFLLQLIEKLIAAAAAAAVLDILLTATGFGGGASFSSIFGQLSGLGSVFGGTSKGSLGGGVVGGGISSAIGSHANGGIFTQPTLGIFGERGPEAIVTPEHLADFAGIQRGSNNSNDYPDYKIFGVFKGSDYQLMGVRSAKTKGRTQ